MIKKIILITMLLAFSTNMSNGYSDYNRQIELFESTHFNTIFSNDSLNKRLDRLENDIFGRTFNQVASMRIQRLSENIITNNFDSAMLTSHEPAIENSVTDYPAITQIEQKLFRKNYANENIYNRLNRIERMSFGQVFSRDNLYDRTNRVISKYKPQYENYVYEDPNRFIAESTTSYTNENMFDTLSLLEHNFLNKTYPQEPASLRVQRLEKSVLGTIQSGDVNSRIDVLSRALSTRSMPSTLDYYNNKYNSFGDDLFNSNNPAPSFKNSMRGFWQSFAGKSYGSSRSSQNSNNPQFDDGFFSRSFTNMGAGVRILKD